MITKFDKSGAVALYKREFLSAAEREDPEAAIDKLLKYTEATGYPDFHLTCGILYLQMMQDSDDRELPVLAFREFMMHIAVYPDCTTAYKGALASAVLRRDPISVVEFGELIKRRGMDLTQILGDLAEAGIDMFSDAESFVDFATLFDVSEYGGIANDGHKDDLVRTESDISERPSRVIKFRGGSDGKRVHERTSVKNAVSVEQLSELSDDAVDVGGVFEIMMQMAKDEIDISDGSGISIVGGMDGESFKMDSDMRARMALRDAERYCDKREFDKALAVLDVIGRANDRIYYCSECVKANIMTELGEYKKAQEALDRAYAVVPEGSLVGILQCRLYELREKFSQIPDVLKNIDVADFVDVDHGYSALMLAVKYCTPDDALDIAEEYADEFNSFDIRLVYAQLLYNAGDREDAIKELYPLTRILYDDFNIQYFYLSARAGADMLPVVSEAPQNILGVMIDNLIAVVNSDVYDRDDVILDSEPFRFSLEMFLTLEFENTRSVMKIMFDTLRKIAADPRMSEITRNALVSPYVEPLVKAVIISEKLRRGERDFLTEVSFCPVVSDFLPTVGENVRAGLCDAYALVTMFCRRALPKLLKEYNAVAACGFTDNERDLANYLWHFAKSETEFSDKSVDNRICFALGYKTKTEYTKAYKQTRERILSETNKNNRQEKHNERQ